MIDCRGAGALFLLNHLSIMSPSKLPQDLASLPKTLIIGLFATAVDVATLVFLIQTFDLTPQQANIPSLLVGSFVQFLGNRYISFKGASRGNIFKQITGFFIAELAALTINAILFYAFVTWTPISYAIARPISTFLVFFGLSYPAWRTIFREHGRFGNED
jgi:putative flippase GtrA